jgi:DNA processing protein
MISPQKIPPLLREIPDAPKQLYIRGKLPTNENLIYLTVIGSRKYSSYGKQACEKLISGLAGYPFVIVSGLALGIDSIAHKTALENDITTIAVPGSGLDDKALYPASNRGLAHNIIRSGGCLISEFEPDFKATKWSFPKRNRIMAGMSHAVLVIEAENKSGTRITARLATEYNRDVLVVPGSIFSETSSGTNALIREGATLVTRSEDIIEYFNLDSKDPVQSQMIPLSEEETRFLDLLDTPKSKNELTESLGISIIKLNILVSSMEIKGLVTESLGKIHKK